MSLQGKVSHYVFVASAGAYVPDGIHAGLQEGDKRKESAGHVKVEQYLQSEGLPYTIFQPLYIYGPHTGKDCEQWFLDRIMRDRPVPIPAPGIQLVALSHVEDVAAMLAKVIAQTWQLQLLLKHHLRVIVAIVLLAIWKLQVHS